MHEHVQISVEEPKEGVDRREIASMLGSSLRWMEFSHIRSMR